LFSFLHPYSKGDLGGGLASLACVHTYTWNATRSMCCLNAASDGGSLTGEESFDKANFTLSLFRSLWTDLAILLWKYTSKINLEKFEPVEAQMNASACGSVRTSESICVKTRPMTAPFDWSQCIFYKQKSYKSDKLCIIPNCWPFDSFSIVSEQTLRDYTFPRTNQI
jgi:hypothetical protein